METYRTIRSNLRKLEPPDVPSISGEVIKKLIKRKNIKRGSILPALILLGASLLITLLIWRKR